MKKVLKNVNILLTRTKNQSVEAVMQLEEMGANVLSFPTIKISTTRDNKELDEIVKRIKDFNTIIFTSENGARSLIEKIDELKIDFDPQAYFIISIGDRTTQVCKEYGFRIDFQSNVSTSGSLIKELDYIDLIGRKILIPSSSLSNPRQFDSLEDHGASVTLVPIYTNNVNDKNNLKNELEELKRTDVDIFIFTSPSTFRGFLKILEIENAKDYFQNKNIAVIGPVTEKALISYGIQPNIIPSKFSMNYLIEEIKNFYSKKDIIDKESA